MSRKNLQKIKKTFFATVEPLSAYSSKEVRKRTKYTRQRYWELQTKMLVPKYTQLERLRLALDLDVIMFYELYKNYLLSLIGHGS